MEYKVKYTRKEYREEYLNSEEWISLRNTILGTEPNCQCCTKKANDVHHLVYRNLVDIKVTDLLPVCRECHNLIHEAIRDGWISQKIIKLPSIREKTINIRTDEKYKEFKTFINGKHYLLPGEIQDIKDLQGFVIQKISGLVKRNVWHDKISEMKFSGKQVLQIRKIIELAHKRRKSRIQNSPRKRINSTCSYKAHRL